MESILLLIGLVGALPGFAAIGAAVDRYASRKLKHQR
jgi:hypothetical protein